ncbi:DUF257 family protein [Thermococcus barophilus]|uniref:KaiC-like domain-containing protein n=1 Tax=Thermococcus barophilus TaxID=55802 RepID=A0A0S1XDZ5_THEBA|nr:DUF257 family protein [Thermococcus barophilus]ALM75989.1 hypothetical protein TBCH5v1_2087 [Thermococcus barophilus]
MEKVGTIRFEDVLERMVPRDTILIKYSSYSHPGIIFCSFVKSLKEKYGERVGIIVVDMLDNLGIIKYQAEAFGIDLEGILRDVTILKVGGSIDVGNVKGRLKVSASYLIHREKFRNKVDSLMKEFEDKEFVIQITFGFDKFLMLLDERERLLQIHDIVKYLTTKSRDVRDIICINTDLWKHLRPYVSEYFEEVALFIGEVVDPHHVKILKTVIPDFKGKVVEF